MMQPQVVPCVVQFVYQNSGCNHTMRATDAMIVLRWASDVTAILSMVIYCLDCLFCHLTRPMTQRWAQQLAQVDCRIPQWMQSPVLEPNLD